MPRITSEYGGAFASQVPVSDNVIANWNTGVATSGLAGADLVTIGGNDIKRGIESCLVSIAALTPGATITIRMYEQINGTETIVYDQDFIQGTDQDGLWLINGNLGIHEALRIEVYSNNVLDDGLGIDYDYTYTV